MDKRIHNHARILLRYCIGAKKGEVVGIDTTAEAEPLVTALYEEILRAGSYPDIRMIPDACTGLLFRYGKPNHFECITPLERARVRLTDAFIRIMASSNTRALSSVPPGKQAALVQTTRKLRESILRKRWTLTLHPTKAYAQDAEMTLEEFEDFVYTALFADRRNPVAAWNALARKQERLVRRLRGADKIRIVGSGTDLTLSVKGRAFINSAGTHNMPSGEIFTGPIESSAYGHIRYDYPVVHGGREIDGITLVFRKGVVVEASADKNEKFLKAMLDMDPGARRLGELGIGTNYDIQRFIKNILFDEKIGGTVHLALGQSYAETGGKNHSALHWDMIKDLRKGGAIYVDGKAIQKDGKFTRG